MRTTYTKYVHMLYPAKRKAKQVQLIPSDMMQDQLVLQSALVIYEEYVKLALVLGMQPKQVHALILKGLTKQVQPVRSKFRHWIYRPILHRVDAVLGSILK